MDGSKFMGYLGQDHRQGAKNFCREILGEQRLFFDKKGGRGRTFFSEKYLVEDLSATTLLKSRFHMKKCHFRRRRSKIKLCWGQVTRVCSNNCM